MSSASKGCLLLVVVLGLCGGGFAMAAAGSAPAAEAAPTPLAIASPTDAVEGVPGAAEAEAVLSAYEERLHKQRQDMAQAVAEVRQWQQTLKALSGAGEPEQADQAYIDVRQVLRRQRQALEDLMTRGATAPAVPLPPPETVAADPAWQEVRLRAGRLAESADALRAEEIANGLAAIDALNDVRLGLLPELSPAKRKSLTSLTAEAWDQARAEAWHLSLIVRAHVISGGQWLMDLQRAGPARVFALLAASAPLVAFIAFFFWFRRWSLPALIRAERRMSDVERTRRQWQATGRLKAMQLLVGVWRPLEWLIFLALLSANLPASLGSLLEVRLAEVILGWFFVTAVAVHFLNTWLSLGISRYRIQPGHPVNDLRLTTLKRIGYFVVVVGASLAVTAELVGRGTIYHWCGRVAWLAAVPLLGWILVSWRDIVFQRLDATNKPDLAMQWALERKVGTSRYAAVAVGGLALLVRGSVRRGRRLMDRYEFVRRIHAFVFRQEIDRLTRNGEPTSRLPLGQDVFRHLGPDTPSLFWQSGPAAEFVATVKAAVDRGEGAVIALIGYRGMGKSHVLRQLAASIHGAVLVGCGEAVTDGQQEQACTAHKGDSPLVLIDDAHRLFRPGIGKMLPFDRVHAHARRHARSTVWVFALEQTTWPFLRRSRDAVPLFDRIHMLRAWSESDLGELLQRRCTERDITPHFDDLLNGGASSPESETLAEDLALRREWFIRLIWDNARGNPGLALEAWRHSLVVDDGGKVFVRAGLNFETLDALETLPVAAQFALRVVLQLEPVSQEDLGEVTRMPVTELENFLQCGLHHGYLVRAGERYAINWRWLRAVRGLLERKHMLVAVS